PTLAPVSNLTAQDLAYIIYTSGSTGKPKGVMIEHNSPVTLINWAQEVFTAEQLAGTLAATSICFDLSIFEIFLPLSTGGTVILADNVLQLPTHPAVDQVTLINTVPTAIAELLRLDGIPVNVSTVNLAGEPIPPSLADQLCQKVPHVYNLYGPSEDTTYSTYIKLNGNESVVPIGRPISNTQAFVVDEAQNPVPIGMPGELLLAGNGLARGYWQRQELTSEKFLAGPPRRYRTGDRVRFRPDGELLFLGRIDSQIKLRGFRIELGEVEAALLQIPGVNQSAAKLWIDAQNNRRLVAYLSGEVVAAAEPGTALSPDAAKNLRSQLAKTLPDFMLPSLFVPLVSLPLLPNGKLNRKVLPDPVLSSAEMAQESTGLTATETALVESWEQLLQRPVGIHDNFFELGGDSILALQAVAKAQAAGVYFSPRDLFQYPTIAELASLAKSAPQASQAPITGEVPLTPIQHWFFAQEFADANHWNQSVLLTVTRSLNPEILSQALVQLAHHHDALRANFIQTDNRWQQIFREPDDIAPLTVITESVDDIQPTLTRIANQTHSSFNLAEGPLWHCVYFELTTPQGLERRLFLVSHHLLVDGLSWRVILEDLQQLYRQLSQGTTPILPPKTLGIPHWIEQLQSCDRKAEIPYWQSVIGAKVTSLPTDFPNGSNTLADQDTLTVKLSLAQTQKILQEVPAAYSVQIDDLLLTALALTLEPWAGSQLSVGLEGHGRNDGNLSRTVGWLTSLYTLVLSLPDAETRDFGQAIKAIKELRRNIPDQGLGFGVLRYLQPSEISQANVEIPLRFNYLGQTDQLFTPETWFAPATESTGNARSPKSERDVLLEINALVSQGELKVYWSYSRQCHRPETIQTLADRYLNELNALIDYCLAPDTDQGYSPGDFPQMSLAQDELDDLLGSLGDLDLPAGGF
ncbi:MAG: condensation domain-containing protein, partial [Cyanobacteria bacterium P01_H01_bin.15]